MSQDAAPAAAIVAAAPNPDDPRLTTFLKFFETIDMDNYVKFLSQNQAFLETALKKDGQALVLFYRGYILWMTLKFKDYVTFSTLKELLRCETPQDVLTAITRNPYDHYMCSALRFEVNRYLMLSPEPIALIGRDVRDAMTECLAYCPLKDSPGDIDSIGITGCLLDAMAQHPNDVVRIFRNLLDVLRTMGVPKKDVVYLTQTSFLLGQTHQNIVFLEIFYLALLDADAQVYIGMALTRILEVVATRPLIRDLKVLTDLPAVNLSPDQRKIIDYMSDGNIAALSTSFQPGPLLDTMCKNARILKLIGMAEKKELNAITELQAALYLPSQEETFNFLIEQAAYVKLHADDIGSRLVPMGFEGQASPPSATENSLAFALAHHAPPLPLTPTSEY